MILRKRCDHLSRLLGNSYEDKLCGKISDGIWDRESKEWQGELDETNQRLAACDSATGNYDETGTRILELANTAYGLYLEQTTEEKAKLLRELLSNLTFTRETLCPTYNKPFDILTAGARF